jgi:hypothetical protein
MRAAHRRPAATGHQCRLAVQGFAHRYARD